MLGKQGGACSCVLLALFSALAQMRGPETEGSGSRSPGDGVCLPWMVILLILGNSFCHVQGELLRPPQNVTLTSENYFVSLTWQPSLDFTNNTQYEVEIMSVYNKSSGPPEWIKVTSCQKNKGRQPQRCDLPLLGLHDLYKARVRARDGAKPSEWTSSKPLQLNKDTIVGPLNLSLAATDDNLKVVVSLPPIPRADDNSSELVQLIQRLQFLETLIEEGVGPRQKRLFQFTENITHYTYDNLKHSTCYCVKVKALNQRTKESVQCLRMPDRPAGDNRILSGTVSAIGIGLILLSVMVGVFFKHLTQWNPLETTLPKSLNLEASGNPALSPVLHLTEECIASVSAEVLPSETSTALQQMPRGCCHAQVWNAYCARGFDARSWSSDTLSSGELEYVTAENYRAAPELTASSAHSSPSSARLLPHDAGGTSCVSQHWEWQIDNKNRPIGSSSSSGPDIPFLSVQQQTMDHILHDPGTCFVRTDSGGPQKTRPAQQATESEEHHEPHGLPKSSDFQDDSSLELRDMKAMTFSGYESRQPVLFCE